MAIATITTLPTDSRCASLSSAQAASLLFGPQLYPRYIRWQRKINSSKEAPFYSSADEWSLISQWLLGVRNGDLPTAALFKAFMGRIKTELYTNIRSEDEDETVAPVQIPPGLELVTATLCGHTIHPGNPCLEVEVCPECIMRQCKASLERIADVWRLLGGPDQRPEDSDIQRLYYTIKKIWHVEKNRWANLVRKYEDFAKLEEDWEEEQTLHTKGPPEVLLSVRSCATALDLASQCPFLTEGWDHEFMKMARGINAKINTSCSPELRMRGGVDFPWTPPYLPTMVDNEDTKPLSPTQGGENEGTEPLGHSQKLGHMTDDASSPSSRTLSSPPRSTHTSSPRSPVSSASSDYAPSPPPPPPTPPRRKVAFGPDTPDHVPRARSAFHRRSLNYTPGRYACSLGSSYIDTSFANDGTFWIFGAFEEDDCVDVDMEDVFEAD